MILPIIVYGAPVLRKKSAEIQEGKTDVSQLAADLFETMENASGVGLAAPQIGKSLRMFVIDTSHMEDEEVPDVKRVFMNPEMLDESGEPWPFEEGCLSIPNVREEVHRPETIRIRFFDENWAQHEETFEGVPARIIQHEYDHLNGVLFTDHLTPLKKRLLKGKLSNISQGKVETSYEIMAPLAKL